MKGNNQRQGATVTEQLASRAHDTIDRAAETAAEAESRIRDGADATAERLKATPEQARRMASESADRVGGYVRERPFLSTGLAFVAGVVFSLLMRR